MTYRDDTTTVFNQLRKRRAIPFNRHCTVSQEARWAALYATDEEFTLIVLQRYLHLRAKKTRDMLDAYGIDAKTRDFKTTAII